MKDKLLGNPAEEEKVVDINEEESTGQQIQLANPAQLETTVEEVVEAQVEDAPVSENSSVVETPVVIEELKEETQDIALVDEQPAEETDIEKKTICLVHYTKI